MSSLPTVSKWFSSCSLVSQVYYCPYKLPSTVDSVQFLPVKWKTMGCLFRLRARSRESEVDSSQFAVTEKSSKEDAGLKPGAIVGHGKAGGARRIRGGGWLLNPGYGWV